MKKAIATGLALLALVSPVKETNAKPTKTLIDPLKHMMKKRKQLSLEEAMKILGIKDKDNITVIIGKSERYYASQRTYKKLTAIAALYAKKARVTIIGNPKAYRIFGENPTDKEIFYAAKKADTSPKNNIITWEEVREKELQFVREQMEYDERFYPNR